MMHRLLILASLAAWLGTFAQPTLAQDDAAEVPPEMAEADPADMPADMVEAMPAENGAAEEGAMPEDVPADAAARPAPRGADAPPPADPVAVQALLDSKPKTPVELFRVIVLLTELNRADAAAPLVKRFLEAKATPADMAAILREHGSAGLLRLSQAEGLGDNGKKIADMVLAGARKHARDPARIAMLVKRLGHSSPAVRRVAIGDLIAAEGDALAALVKTLADPASANLKSGVQEALLAMGRLAVDPLAAVLETKDDKLAIVAMDTLREIADRAATPYLLGPALSASAARREAATAALTRISGRVPTAAEIEKLLAREADAYLAGTVRLPTHGGDIVTLWHWDDAKRTVSTRTYHYQDAPAYIAARLSRELFTARPNNRAYQRLAVLSSLEAAKLASGLDTPLAPAPGGPLDRAVKQGVAILEDALAEALEKRYAAGATGALEALASAGDASILAGRDGRISPIVQAVRDSNRRIRFAAMDAILRLDAQSKDIRPYPGSSSVVDALNFFVAASGTSRALVIEPRSQRAVSLAGLLNEVGFQSDAAVVGQAGRVLLNTSADYELVFVDMGVDNPEIYDLLGQLRRDPRTAQLPIGLMALDGQLDRAKRVAAAFPRTEAFPQAADKSIIEYQTGVLLPMQGRHALSPQVRQRQAEVAMAHLAKLAQTRQAVYDLSRCQEQVIKAMDESRLVPGGAAVLAALGTPTAQKALVDLASQSARPIALRRAAAAAFAKSVPQHGIQLTSDEIVMQYDRYNGSRELDEETQKLLGSILDAIEKKGKASGEAKG